MSGFSQKLRGNLYLAYRALIAHPLRKLLRQEQGTGQQRFLANYGPEGNIPYSAEDRVLLQGASRCIHCGLCNAYDRALLETSRQLYGGASLLPVSFSRATPDLPRARAALAAISADSLVRSEAVCPTRVPLRALYTFLNRKLSELDAIRAEAAALRPAPAAKLPPPPGAKRSAEDVPPSRLADRAPDSATVRALHPPRVEAQATATPLLPLLPAPGQPA